MINLTSLFSTKEDPLRYTKECKKTLSGVKVGVGPVIAWNITNKCNYRCKHCYSKASFIGDEKELTTNEAERVIDDLFKINVPVILFSGGEPLLRSDIFHLIQYARDKNIRVCLSTNGSLIDRKMAIRIKKADISYVGISIDGIGSINDQFRGIKGAYLKSVAAVENCHEVGQKVGLRFTLQKKNFTQVAKILDLLDRMEANRICFYHLVPSGRGEEIYNEALSGEETRVVMDLLYQYIISNDCIGKKAKEILTVDNHCDGVYLYLKAKKYLPPEKANRIYRLLSYNGGNRSGIAIANIDSQGNVFADQFSKAFNLGNVKKNLFSEIWEGSNLLKELRDRKGRLKGKCNFCSWLNLCNGNLRARAYGVYKDFWEEDPGCYLTEQEISEG
ncbi:radical SAM protein [Bacillota bacterium LX-D]|nr:radical SAM protein [Bacillota bacterium LX-D]